LRQTRVTSTIGHAAVAGVVVTIPRLLRGLCQSFVPLTETAVFCLTAALVNELDEVEYPPEPTRLVDKYLGDWWNYMDEEEGYGPVDEDTAFEEWFQFHVANVSNNLSGSIPIANGTSQFALP
jgi:hypothetical protein